MKITQSSEKPLQGSSTAIDVSPVLLESMVLPKSTKTTKMQPKRLMNFPTILHQLKVSEQWPYVDYQKSELKQKEKRQQNRNS